MSLNAEPSLPTEREAAHLAPKTYKDAVLEYSPPEDDKASSPVMADQTNGTNGAHVAPNGTIDVNEKGTASVLRIVSTHGEGNGESNGRANEDKSGLEEEEPEFGDQNREVSQDTCGQDETPKSQTMPKQKPMKPSQEWNSKGSARDSEDDLEDLDVFERFSDKGNGERLISVKQKALYLNTAPSKDVPRSRDAKDAKDEDRTLVSGRRAGQRWHQSGIRFAPWNVPLQRRLQTLVVLFHTISIPLFVSFFFFLCAIPIFWPILIPYLIYLSFSKAATSGTLSHRSDFLRSSSIWSLFASYFPARLHRTAVLSPTRKYIFGYHPHGIISHGAFAAFGTEALGFSQLFPDIRNTLLTLDSNFRIPLYRDYALAMGLGSVSRQSIENLLMTGGADGEGMGRAITIVIGGAAESLVAQPGIVRLVLNRRYGFIKMALRTGSDLVPVLAFGENEIYDQVTSHSHPRIHKVQLQLKKALGFTLPLFHARGVFNYDVGLMPYRRPINIIVGRPITVVKEERPKQESIERLHEEYKAELLRLWDTWKGDFAPNRKEELVFLD